MPYTAITRAQLRTRLQGRVESAPFWTDTEANEVINEALLTWGMLTGRWRRTLVISTNPGAVDYVFPLTLTWRARVAFNNQPMSPASRTELNFGRASWWNDRTTTGGAVPSRPTLWAPISLNWIAIWPADAAGHNSLTIEGVSATPQLTDDAQFVDLAEADVSVLLGFMLHVLTFKKGDPWFQATMPDFRAFLAAAALENSLIATSQFYRQWMGLDRRDLKPFTLVPSRVAGMAAQAGGDQ